MYDKARSIQEFLAMLDHLDNQPGAKKLKVFLSTGEGIELSVELEEIEPRLILIKNEET